MKKHSLLISGFLLLAIFSYSQKTPTTQPNGVIVHEAQGVEGPTKEVPTLPASKTISDWSLAECIDAEPYFYNKLTTASAEDKQYYTDQVEMLRKRKAELMNPQSKTK